MLKPWTVLDADTLELLFQSATKEGAEENAWSVQNEWTSPRKTMITNELDWNESMLTWEEEQALKRKRIYENS